ncbi:MAG: hypothetical protein WC188_03065 [Candidatus Caldatribacteriota bacterium]
MTLSEKKYFKDEKNLIYPLMVKKSGPQIYLEFMDPATKNIQYTSDKFYRKRAYERYLADENFRNAFDYVVDVSVEQRIINGLFQMKLTGQLENIVTDQVSAVEEILEENVPVETQTCNIDPPQTEEVVPSEIEGTYESAFD